MTCLSMCVCVCAGTTERVCLIQGTVEALNGVHDFIAEKVREMPQSTQKTEPVSILQPQTTVNPDRVKQVSLTLCLFCSVLFYKNPKLKTETIPEALCVCLLVVLVCVYVCQRCLRWRGVWGGEGGKCLPLEWQTVCFCGSFVIFCLSETEWGGKKRQTTGAQTDK